MNDRKHARNLLLALVLVFVGGRLLPAAEPDMPLVKFEPAPDLAQLEFFEKNIRPVLTSKCYKCHSAEAEKPKGGLLLDTRAGIREGGETGHAIVPGSLNESLLIKAIHYGNKDLQMPPPKSGGKLPDAVIADFEKWVQMGAPDPREGVAKVVRKKVDPAHAREFWSFKPVTNPPPPAVSAKTWPRTDVDRFVLAGLEAKGLKPVADADRRALIRRVTFDLIGLPPQPAEVEAYVNDPSPQPLDRVVDRLLASPQFGERWGRHWLDVARYAESTGKERNYTYPEAWRYRDYVFASFNTDKPYNEFVREQIAGDLMPSPDIAGHNEHLVATGFLALGTKGLNEKNREQFRMDLIDEQIDTTSRAVMGLTIACARCHDHKFDPITTRDYYALAGILRSTQTFYGTSGGKDKNPSSLLPLASALVKGSAGQVAAVVETQPPEAEPAVRKKKGKSGKKSSAPAAPVPAPLTPPAATATVPVEYAMGVRDGKIANCPIYLHGEITSPDILVPRGLPAVLTANPPPQIPPQQSGRMELANWLVASDNPLTARVMVNRVWLHLFGRGLVRTADNFGATGDPPSNPALLDHLASQFVSDGWSVKKLVRSIVLSHTYQLSSLYDAKNFLADPENTLFWRANLRRLDAEEIRDAILSASGQLDLVPMQGSVVQRFGNGDIGKGIPTTAFNPVSRKRSVYLPIVRELVPDVLTVFDFAEPSLVVANRDATNVPTQALFLLNSQFVLTQAGQMANRLQTERNLDFNHRLVMAYQLTLGRPPTPAERLRGENYLRAESQGLIPTKQGNAPEADTEAWATFCQALFACAEFRYLK